jgi:hypothetical protein
MRGLWRDLDLEGSGVRRGASRQIVERPLTDGFKSRPAWSATAARPSRGGGAGRRRLR